MKRLIVALASYWVGAEAETNDVVLLWILVAALALSFAGLVVWVVADFVRWRRLVDEL
jgi:hypothetical protein